MCQLLGMNCNTPTDIVFSFEGFAQRGGLTDHHSDGWGIAFFEDRACRLMIDTQASYQSPVAELVRTYPIKSLNVIAHIRKATQGEVTLENCHPFMRELWGRHWVFAHNGNLEQLHLPIEALYQPVGSTDSEQAFCMLLHHLRHTLPHASAHTPPNIDEISQALAQIVPQIAALGTFNFCLSNGQALWAHCSTHLHFIVREYPFTTAHLKDADVLIDFAEHTTIDDRVAVIATQPLTDNETWQMMHPGQFLVFENGQPSTIIDPSTSKK